MRKKGVCLRTKSITLSTQTGGLGCEGHSKIKGMSLEQQDEAFGLAVAAAPAMQAYPALRPTPGIAVVEIKGVPPQRRDSLAAAIVAAGSSLSELHEAWVVPARKPPAYKVRVVGPRGFYREIHCAGPETDHEVQSRVRAAVAE